MLSRHSPTVAVREPTGALRLPTTLDLTVSSPRARGMATGVGYAIPAQAEVSLVVYDAAGNLVRTLAAGTMRPGFCRADWNGTDAAGRAVSGGVYFVSLEAAGHKLQRKVVLLR
jgi:flagellar hook assembly protein FlgD